MQFLKRLTFYVATITTFTLLACAVWITIEMVGNGMSLQADFLPVELLWQVLVVGVVCGFATALLIAGEAQSRKEVLVRFGTHYVVINAIILGCGALFGWYTVTPVGVLMMMLTVALVYVAVATMSYLRDKSIADKINERLEHFHRGQR